MRCFKCGKKPTTKREFFSVNNKLICCECLHKKENEQFEKLLNQCRQQNYIFIMCIPNTNDTKQVLDRFLCRRGQK